MHRPKTMHAPQKTTHAPLENHAHPPWEQPCMHPRATTHVPQSNHACPPGKPCTPPRNNHTCPPEQPCMPLPEQPCKTPLWTEWQTLVRMHTSCLLTICCSLLPGWYLLLGGLLPGGVCSWGCLLWGGVPGPRGSALGGYLLWGMSAPGDCLLRGCLLLEGGVCFWGCVWSRGCVWSEGVCLVRGVCLVWGVHPSMHWGRPPVDRILDTRLWKYYLDPTSLRPVINETSTIVKYQELTSQIILGKKTTNMVLFALFSVRWRKRRK